MQSILMEVIESPAVRAFMLSHAFFIFATIGFHELFGYTLRSIAKTCKKPDTFKEDTEIIIKALEDEVKEKVEEVESLEETISELEEQVKKLREIVVKDNARIKKLNDSYIETLSAALDFLKN